MLARDNSSAYAGLLAKILPHQLATETESHGRVEIRFKRIIVYPGGREESDDTPKQIEHKASQGLPNADEIQVEPKDIKELDD